MKEAIKKMILTFWKLEDYVELHKQNLNPIELICPWCRNRLMFTVNGKPFGFLARRVLEKDPSAKLAFSCDCEKFEEAKEFSQREKKGETAFCSNRKITLADMIKEKIAI